jgi:hypothetical protein
MRIKASEAVQKYLADTRQRAIARRRLPVWLALLMPFIALFFVFGTTLVCILAAAYVHNVLYPETTWRAMGGAAQFLIFAAAFIMGLAPGLIFANAALWIVRPVRQILDANAEGVKGLSFYEGMSGLIKVAAFTVPLGFLFLAIAMGLK